RTHAKGATIAEPIAAGRKPESRLPRCGLRRVVGVPMCDGTASPSANGCVACAAKGDVVFARECVGEPDSGDVGLERGLVEGPERGDVGVGPDVDAASGEVEGP